ncbi:MAG: HIRAN domain-containing protein [Clostridiales bacterium]|nr:HIRAN domain-containing protein [Clostridiales bacterium]
MRPDVNQNSGIENKNNAAEKLNTEKTSALSNVEENAIAKSISNGTLSSVVEPLIKEIHLFDSYVSGTMFIDEKDVIEKLVSGQEVSLEREKNKFDENAIAILTSDRKKIGYIPEEDNSIFARLMDAGKLLRGRIRSVEKECGFKKIIVGIFLIDV